MKLLESDKHSVRGLSSCQCMQRNNISLPLANTTVYTHLHRQPQRCNMSRYFIIQWRFKRSAKDGNVSVGRIPLGRREK